MYKSQPIKHRSIDKIVFLKDWIFITGTVSILPFVFTKALLDKDLSSLDQAPWPAYPHPGECT